MQISDNVIPNDNAEAAPENGPKNTLIDDHAKNIDNKETGASFFYTDTIFSFSIEDNQRIVLGFNPLMAKVKEIDYIELFYMGHKVTRYLSDLKVPHSIEINRNGSFKMCIVLKEKREQLLAEMSGLVSERLRTNF